MVYLYIYTCSIYTRNRKPIGSQSDTFTYFIVFENFLQEKDPSTTKKDDLKHTRQVH